MGNRECASCGAPATEVIGPLPASAVFAGQPLTTPLPGGNLRRCPECLLYFRFPRLDKDELDRLYAVGTSESWSVTDDDRVDWRLAREWIDAEPVVTGKVLDVGCFDGEFLSQLGAQRERFGIEIHSGAASEAQRRGVRILGDDLEAALAGPGIEDQFDVVCAFDVIEHVADPAEFLRRLAAAARPGGAIVVATGDVAAPTWRLMKAGYWYCGYAEHISFIHPGWCDRIAASCGLVVEHTSRFSRSPGARWTAAAKELAMNLMYRVSPTLVARLRRSLRRSSGAAPDPMDRFPPTWMSARDHFIVRFRKAAPTADVSHPSSLSHFDRANFGPDVTTIG